MADAVEVLDHRHGGLARDPLDQGLSAARNDHVHPLRTGDQAADRGPVGGRHHLDRVRRQSGFGQAFLDQGRQGAIAVDRFRPAAKDGGVAGLDAKAGRIDRHVRPRLVDDADDAQRHAHAADLDAARALAEVADLADRVRQQHDLLQPGRHLLDRILLTAPGGRRRPDRRPASRAPARSCRLASTSARSLVAQQACDRAQRRSLRAVLARAIARLASRARRPRSAM